MCFFFFFKQKTAYELRISDWSSDVCSSDLVELAQRVLARVRQLDLGKGDMIETDLGRVDDRAESDDQSAFLHPFDALLARCLGQADLLRERGEGDAAILPEDGEKLAIELVQIEIGRAHV